MPTPLSLEISQVRFAGICDAIVALHTPSREDQHHRHHHFLLGNAATNSNSCRPKPLLPHAVDDHLHWNWIDSVSEVAVYLCSLSMPRWQSLVESPITFSRSMHSPLLLTLYSVVSASNGPNSRMHPCFWYPVSITASRCLVQGEYITVNQNVTVQPCLETSCQLLFLFLHPGTLTLQYQTQNSQKYLSHKASLFNTRSHI